MDIAELIIGIPLVAALLILAAYFARHQFKTRRDLAQNRELSSEERGFLIRQSRRRLITSVLMFLLAGFLVGWFFIESQLPDLKDVAEQEPGKTHPLLELVAYYWIFALMLLFGILTLAGMDFFSTARFAMSQKRLLQLERRTALEEEVARLRERKND